MRSIGSTFASGTNALVDLLLAQAALDKSRGLDSAGFVSGYRGSPLGGLDQALWRRSQALADAHIRFQPAINEDLGATALIGTQKVETDPARMVQGVFGLWYGKGPGVDRSGDALKHGNAYGASPHGGVLVVTGDDHGCVSSSMSHQSDLTMIAWSMPVLHPATVADYRDVGLWGWAASRVSGAWVGFKAVSEIVESGMTIRRRPLPSFEIPEVDPGPDGLHWRWPDLPGPQVEKRLRFKLKAIEDFARLNPIDRLVVPCARPHALLVTVGKSHQDVLEALRVGDLTPRHLTDHGVIILQVSLVFPLSPLLRSLASEVKHIFVVEEKAPVVETLLAHHLFNIPINHRPSLWGKRDIAGRVILPEDIELRPARVASALAKWLCTFNLELTVPPQWVSEMDPPDLALPKRTPYFCAGCPHSTSTRVPEGSKAQPGIGCHVMASWMDRSTGGGSVQMGGEGVDWVGHAPFTATPHIFQNLGDGTYFHSGHLAIRQSVAAGSNITFKILYNDAVAMTGGQPVDGRLTVAQIATLVLAEGAKAVAVVAENPDRYCDAETLPMGVLLRTRDHLEAVQRDFRVLKGVTVIIYDQVCATELRRRRKRGLTPDTQTYAVINELVCEGCGDCQIQSNCVAVVPLETSLGRKRAIDQDACNSDLSCLKGFCPSFVTVRDVIPRRTPAAGISLSDLEALTTELEVPHIACPRKPWEVLLAGIGGTGIVTAANLLARAAEYDANAVRVLNFTGFSQKGGEVLSHVRFCQDETQLHQVRIARGRANLVIAADLVVGVSTAALEVMSTSFSRCVANTHETQLGAMLRDPSMQLDGYYMTKTLRSHCQRLDSTDAEIIASRFVGDHDQTNIVLLGYAWQLGTLPVTLSAVELATKTLGTAADNALRAFHLGRVAAAQPDVIKRSLVTITAPVPPSLDDLIAHRRAFLVDYQDEAYARRYIERVERVRAATKTFNDESLARAVGENLFKLMAYKDEYEVARLFVDTGFLGRLREQFDGKPKLRFHISPPLIAPKDARTGRRGKISIGAWIIPLLRLLAKGRRLRGTPLDLFGLQAERYAERAMLADYEALIDRLVTIVTPDLLVVCRQLAELPSEIRGFGYVKTRTAVRLTERKQILLDQLDHAGSSVAATTTVTPTAAKADQPPLTGQPS